MFFTKKPEQLIELKEMMYEIVDLNLNNNLIGFNIKYLDENSNKHKIHPLIIEASQCKTKRDTRIIIHKLINDKTNFKNYLRNPLYLFEIEEKVKSELLSIYPKKYAELFLNPIVKDVKESLLSEERKLYVGALNLLNDYCVQTDVLQDLFNRKPHIARVKAVIQKHDPYVLGNRLGLENTKQIKKFKKNSKLSDIVNWDFGYHPLINLLLKDLETSLSIRPERFSINEDLARRIDYIQDFCGIYVIDISELNKKLSSEASYYADFVRHGRVFK